MIRKICFLLLLFSFFSCTKNEEENFRVVPTTNNPDVVPNYGNTILGMPSSI
jgi:hypothetical protein